MPSEVTFSLKLSIEQLRTALKQARREFSGSMKSMASSAARESRRMNGAMDNLGIRPLREITREIKKTEASYVRLARSGKLSMQELSRAKLSMIQTVRTLKRESGGWVNAMTKAKAELAATAATVYGITRALRGAAGAYSEYTTKMAEVYTLVDTTPEKFQALSDGVRKMSTDLGKPAAESAQALYDIISAGVAMEDSLKVLELSTKAAVAGVTDTQTAARAGLAVVNAYGMSMDRLGGVYDTLFATVKSGVTTLPQLAQHLGEALPVASAAKVGFAEVAAAVAQMTKSGLRTPQAVTALKGAITALSAPTPEAKRKLEELGITWRGFTETVGDISSLDLGTAAMREIIPDVEARTAVLALTNNYKGLTGALREMKDVAGAMPEAYGKMEQTPARKIEKLTASIKDMGIQLGALLSTLTPAAEAATAFLQSLNAAPGFVKGTAAAVLAMAGGTILWKIALKDTIEILRSATLALGGYTVAAKAAVAANLAAGLGPAKAALAGVATAARAALVAMGPWAAIAGVAAAGALGISYAFKKLNEELEKNEKAVDNTGKSLRYFADLKNQLAGIGLGDSGLAADVAKAQIFFAVAARNGANVESAAAKKIKSAYTERVTAARQAHDEIIRVDQRRGELEKQLAEEVKKAKVKNLEEEITAVNDTAQKRISAERGKSRGLIAAEREVLSARKAALAGAREAERNYASEVKRLEGEIKDAKSDAANFQSSIADKLRQLARKGMTSALQEKDTLTAIERERGAALEASSRGEAELAKQHARRAAALADELADEEKKKKALTEAGELYGEIANRQTAALAKSKTENEKNLAAARRKITDIETSITSTQEAIKALETGFESLKKTIEQGAAKKVKELNSELEKLTKEDTVTQIKADISAADTEIDKLKKTLADLAVGITVPIKPEAKLHRGGPVKRLATGGAVFGPGGVDRVPAMLTAGEYVIRKSVVDRLGLSFLHAINNLDISSLRRYPSIHIPEIPKTHFATGGLAVAGATDSVNINFNVAGRSYPLTGPRDRVNQLKDDLMELARGVSGG